MQQIALNGNNGKNKVFQVFTEWEYRENMTMASHRYLLYPRRKQILLTMHSGGEEI